MNYIFENINFDSEIPIKIFIHNLNYAQNHWHDALEILFVLEGSIKIGIGNEVYTMEKEDLIAINPHEIHTTFAEQANMVLALQISDDWINKAAALKEINLNCNSSVSKKGLHMNRIRTVLAQMMWVYNNHENYFELRIQSYLLELLYQLFSYFQIENLSQKPNEHSGFMPRLSNIVHYIHENYNENITLQDLADKEYLSISYISRFFKKNIGTSFKEYIIRLRLEHAVKDLLYTEKSIAQLSYDNGFPNTNSFLEAFKESYKDTPSLYRKKAKEDYQFLYGPNMHSCNYFEMQNVNIFSSLYKYLNVTFRMEDSRGNGRDDRESLVDTDFGNVDLSQTKEYGYDNWRNLITVGKAKDILDLRVRVQLEKVQKELNYRYIRFHGIFDDEMKLYREDGNGNPKYDFIFFDRIIDFLYEINLKPFIEIGFMPSQLANSKHTMFQNRPSIISKPKDIEKWCVLVRTVILHSIERYGQKEVESWYFEFWNEPNITDVFWYDSFEDYLTLYSQTFQTIKEISKEIKVGGPAICNSDTMLEWIREYFSFCETEKCLPDFFTFHSYLHVGNLMETQNSTKAGLLRITLSEDADYLKRTFERIKEAVSDYQYDAKKIHMTEWNASPSHRDLTHDTVYMASYIVKNILENIDSIGSFGFWTFTDLIEEFPIPEEYFHGGLGVVTYNGIEKAGYHAFRFLNLLGDKKISSGPGYFVTKRGDNFQILLYHYCHYDSLYCSMDHSGITPLNRYDIYGEVNTKTIKLVLKGIKKETYKIKEHTVNRDHGSAFDAWIDMGAPKEIKGEELRYIRSKSLPHYCESKENIEIEHVLIRTLSPHEIRLIEFEICDIN